VRGGDDLRTTVAAQIGQRNLLLVLDNFEQAMAAADEVADLLRACPHLRVIVTSRESLRVRGEQLIEVAPLSFPEPSGAAHDGRTADELAAYEAVHLFLERATEARPDFVLTDANAPTVAAVCSRLDGLPLAIELAAARLRLFTVEELLDRLGSGLDVLRGGARDLPERQRTLRGTIAWSHDLLDEDEREVFQLLSVFESAQIEAVEQVAARCPWLGAVDVVDVLASLVDKSLIRGSGVPSGRGRRLSMLATIREFAAERLAEDAGRLTSAREAHAAYFSALAAGKAPELAGSGRSAALDDLAVELGNFTVAWRFFVEQADIGRLNGLLDVLWPLHESRGWYHGALALLNDLLTVLATLPPNPHRTAKELTVRISVARVLLAIRGYTDEVESLYRSAIALAEAEGSIPKQLPVLRSLASFHLYRGEIEKTVAIGEKVLRLADAENDDLLRVEGHLILGPSLAFLGRGAEGLAHLDEALALYDPERHAAARFRIGPNPGVAAAAVSALLEAQLGAFDEADRRAALALDLARRVAHPYSLAYATFHVGMLDLLCGRFQQVRERALAVQAIAAANDYPIWAATGLVLEGIAMATLDDPAAGLARLEQGIAQYQEHPTPPVFWPLVHWMRGRTSALAGRLDDALAILDEAAAIADPMTWDGSLIRVERGNVLAQRGDPAAASASYRAALAGFPGRSTQLMASLGLANLSDDDRALAVATLREVLPALCGGGELPFIRAARRIAELPLAPAGA
jgi:predicted ATPase